MLFHICSSAQFNYWWHEHPCEELSNQMCKGLQLHWVKKWPFGGCATKSGEGEAAQRVRLYGDRVVRLKGPRDTGRQSQLEVPGAIQAFSLMCSYSVEVCQFLPTLES